MIKLHSQSLSGSVSGSIGAKTQTSEDIEIKPKLNNSSANDPPCPYKIHLKQQLSSILSVRFLILTLLMVGTFLPSKAQVDPALATMIMAYTSKAEGALKSQQKAMAMQTPAFILTAEQINHTVALQRQYNDYLENFRSIVVYGAQIYGFYQQITNMVNTFKDFLNQLAKTPDNAFALALSSNSSNIYLQLITQSIDICNDIRKICFSSIKMTESDRLEIVFQIRPKLRAMTRQLRNLTLAVKYTTFNRLWKSFDLNHNRFELDKSSISKGAFRRWRDNIK